MADGKKLTEPASGARLWKQPSAPWGRRARD